MKAKVIRNLITSMVIIKGKTKVAIISKDPLEMIIVMLITHIISKRGTKRRKIAIKYTSTQAIPTTLRMTTVK